MDDESADMNIRYGCVKNAELEVKIEPNSTFSDQKIQLSVDFVLALQIAYDSKTLKHIDFFETEDGTKTFKFAEIDVPQHCTAIIARVVFANMPKSGENIIGTPQTNQIIIPLVGNSCTAIYQRNTRKRMEKMLDYYRKLLSCEKFALDSDPLKHEDIHEGTAREFADTMQLELSKLLEYNTNFAHNFSEVEDDETLLSVHATFKRNEEKDFPGITREEFEKIFSIPKERWIEEVVYTVSSVVMATKYRNATSDQFKYNPDLWKMISESPVLGASSSLKEIKYDSKTKATTVGPTPCILRMPNFAIAHMDEHLSRIKQIYFKLHLENVTSSSFLEIMQTAVSDVFLSENKDMPETFKDNVHQEIEDALTYYLHKQCYISGLSKTCPVQKTTDFICDTKVAAFFLSRPFVRFLLQRIDHGAGLAYVTDFRFKKVDEIICADIGESWDAASGKDDCDGESLFCAHTHREMQRIMVNIANDEEDDVLHFPATALMSIILVGCLRPGVAWGTVKKGRTQPGGHMWWSLQRVKNDKILDELVYKFISEKTGVLAAIKKIFDLEEEFGQPHLTRLVDTVLSSFTEKVLCEATSKFGCMNNINKAILDIFKP